MGYLIAADYKKQIQSVYLDQIIGSDSTIQGLAEQTALEEATSYLVQKYNMAQELQNTPLWDKTLAYKAGNRVYLNPAVFDPLVVYTTGQYVVFSANVYQSLAGSAAHAFVPAEWKLICQQYQIFGAIYPKPIFDYSAMYNVGDQVFWKDKTYTCKIATTSLSQSTALQYRNYESVPFGNIAPDDINNGIIYWGVGVAYSIAANTDIQNASWLIGDNRSQMLITYLIDITLYHLHSRVAPHTVPDLRIKRYDDAIRMLKGYAKGETTAEFPLLKPTQGLRIRYGGNIKQVNSY